jgi:hypothetical protein
MSLNHVGLIKCSTCENKQPFTFWESINVTVDPKLKDELTSGKLTTFVCETCGLEGHVTSDCLYHDMERNLAIWLRYSEDDQSINEEATYAKRNKMDDYLVTEGYKLRIVRSFPELIDKIRVFDDDFSDYVIELVKLMTCLRERIALTTPMYYAGLEHGESDGTDLVFVLRIDNQLFRKGYPTPECLQGAEAMMPVLTKHFDVRDKWPHVNRFYLLRALEKAGILDKPD